MLHTHIKKVLKLSAYFMIPIIVILLCKGLKIAQGEQNEEIVFGLMVGLLLDFVYSIILVLLGRQKKDSH